MKRATICVKSECMNGIICPDCGSVMLIEHTLACYGAEDCDCPPGNIVLECHECESYFTPFDDESFHPGFAEHFANGIYADTDSVYPGTKKSNPKDLPN